MFAHAREQESGVERHCCLFYLLYVSGKQMQVCMVILWSHYAPTSQRLPMFAYHLSFIHHNKGAGRSVLLCSQSQVCKAAQLGSAGFDCLRVRRVSACSEMQLEELVADVTGVVSLAIHALAQMLPAAQAQRPADLSSKDEFPSPSPTQ